MWSAGTTTPGVPTVQAVHLVALLLPLQLVLPLLWLASTQCCLLALVVALAAEEKVASAASAAATAVSAVLVAAHARAIHVTTSRSNSAPQ